MFLLLSFDPMPHFLTADFLVIPACVIPESVLKKQKREEQWALAKQQELEPKKKKKNREKRKLIFARAQQYAKEYASLVLIGFALSVCLCVSYCRSSSRFNFSEGSEDEKGGFYVSPDPGGQASVHHPHPWYQCYAP